MREIREDLTGFTSQLNWRGTTRFAELAGQVSGSSGINFDRRIFNYTSLSLTDVDFDFLASVSHHANTDCAERCT